MKMPIEKFRETVDAAIEYSKMEENLHEDGSVNWDYVSSDVYRDMLDQWYAGVYLGDPLFDFDAEDVEAALCAASAGIPGSDIWETVEA